MIQQIRVLALELGATEAGKGVLDQIRLRLPGVWIAGVEKATNFGNSSFDHVITTQRDAFYGRYPEIDTSALAVTPELHDLLKPLEGKLLNLAGLASVRSPNDYPQPIRGVPVFVDSYDARKDLIDRHSRFWNAVFDQFQFHAVIHENLGQEVYDYVALSVARARGIPSLVFNLSGQFPRVLFVQENENELGSLALGRLLKGELKSNYVVENSDFIRRALPKIRSSTDAGIAGDGSQLKNTEYQTHPITSWLFDRNIYKNEISLLLVTKSVVTKLGRFFKSPRERIRVFRNTRALLRDTSIAMREESANSKPFKPDCPYIYLPLHFQPETSTSVKGRHFYTLREAVAFIASELPAGWRLVVKEHPHQHRRLLKRVPGFYSQIAAIPNVDLLHHTTSNETLVQGARAVACVSHSSITANALFAGKPIISIGDSHLREAPNYHCVTRTAELREVIRKIAFSECHLDAEQLELFIEKLELSTFEGEFGERPESLSPEQWKHCLSVTAGNVGGAIVEWLRLRVITN